MNEINVILNWFISAHRGYEFLECVKKTAANPYVTRLYILATEEDFIFLKDKIKESNKLIHLIFNNSNARPTYRQYFEYMNAVTAVDDINIITNTDIYFDESIQYAAKYLVHRKILALTRWNVLKTGVIEQWTNPGSQDTWIWKGEINLNRLEIDFPLGVWGCDNRIAYELGKNYTVINPSNTIRCIHLHLMEYRSEESSANSRYTIPPPYKFIAITD